MSTESSSVRPLSIPCVEGSAVAQNERLIALEMLDTSADATWRWSLATIPGATVFSSREEPHSVSGSPRSTTPSAFGSPRAVDVAQTRVVQVQSWRSAASLADALAASVHCTEAIDRRVTTPRDIAVFTAVGSPTSARKQREGSSATVDAGGKEELGKRASSRRASTTPRTARSGRCADRLTARTDRDSRDGGNGEDDEVLAQTLDQTHALLQQALRTPRTDEGKRLVDLIERKRGEFDGRAAEIKASMREMRMERDDALKAQAEAERVYQRSQQELRRARQNVEQLDMKHLREVQTYRTPPAVVQWVMKGVMVALGDSAREWRDITCVLRNPGFIRSVVAFEPALLTTSQRKELIQTYVAAPKFTMDEVNKGSEAVAPLYEWLIKELDMGSAVERLEVVRAEEAKRRARVEAIRSSISHSANELESMEDELRDLLAELHRCEEEGEAHVAAVAAIPSEAEEAVGSPWLTTSDSGVKVPRHYMRGAFRVWQRPETSHDGLTRVLRTSILCDLGPSPPLGATLTLTAEQRSCLEHAIASRLSQGAVAPTTAGASAPDPDVSRTTSTSHTLGTTSPPVEDGAANRLGGGSSSSSEGVVKHGGVDAEEQLAQHVRSLLNTLEVEDAPEDTAAASHSSSPSTAGLLRAVELAERRATAMNELLALQQAKLSEYEAEQVREAQCNPLCEPQDTVVSHCHKVLEGEAWGAVLADAADELTRAFTDDVALVCRVPSQHITNVSFATGSLHVDFDVTHDAKLRAWHVQDAVDVGEYPATFALYHAWCASREAASRQPPQATWVRDGPGDVASPTLMGGLPPLHTATRTTSLPALPSHGVLAEGSERADPLAMSGESAQLSPRFAVIEQTSSQASMFESQREQRALSDMVWEARRLTARLEAKDAQIGDAQKQAKEAEERLRQAEVEHARAREEMQHEIEALHERVDELQLLHATQRQTDGLRGEAHGLSERATTAATGESAKVVRGLARPVPAMDAAAPERAQKTLVITHCRKVFDGEEWNVVLEDSPDDLARAFVDDTAAACGVPNRFVQNVNFTVGSLHVECDVQHAADVNPADIQQCVDDATYDSLMAVYAQRGERRAAKQAQAQALAALTAANEAVAVAQEEEKRSREALNELRRQLDEKTAALDTAKAVETKAVEKAAQLQQDLFEKEKELLGMENHVREARRAKETAHDELARVRQGLTEELQQQQVAYMAEMNRLHDEVVQATKAKESAVGEAHRVHEMTAREGDEDTAAKVTSALEASGKEPDQQRQVDALSLADARLAAALEADIVAKESAARMAAKEVAAMQSPCGDDLARAEEEDCASDAQLAQLQARIELLDAAVLSTADGASAEATAGKTALVNDLATLLRDLNSASDAHGAAKMRVEGAWRDHEEAMKRASDQLEEARRARSVVEEELRASAIRGGNDQAKVMQRTRDEHTQRIAELEAVAQARGREVAETYQTLTETLERRAQHTSAALKNVERSFGVSTSPDSAALEPGVDERIATWRRGIYTAAAARAASARNDSYLQTACLVGMLVVGLASLQYKRYSV